ncbi:MAG: NAD(P)H-dependent oxidoreductase [Microbacteriaceae bacterium]|nr:NAD(P)H-dependent oxidoreductase [Microbacteriaceae bacterium]MCL2796045.1 NAD(P)H-dependent oxidoreductase [Microbacteriaceae bacterium]
MPSLLRLDSSIDPDTSVSRRLTGVFAQAWAARGAEHTTVTRDLVADPVPHLSHAALHWAPRLRGDDAPALPEADAVQEAVIAQLLAADVLLVGAPMYNYSIPSQLKTWLDHVHVPGVLAPFDTDTQPLAGRPAVIVSSRGGVYDVGTASADWDHTLPPIGLILGSALGMEVHVVTVSRTLSGAVPGLAGERDRFADELAAAEAELVELAGKLG